MALLAYFQQDDSILPNPDSPLSTAVSVSAIRVANKEVKPVLDLSSMAEGKTSKRGPYNHFIPKERHISTMSCWKWCYSYCSLLLQSVPWLPTNKLGHRKSAKIFSVKVYFQVIRKSFHLIKANRWYSVHVSWYVYPGWWKSWNNIALNIKCLKTDCFLSFTLPSWIWKGSYKL